MLRGMLWLFVIVPLVELYLLTLIAQATSFWFTVALTVLTGLVGGTLAKREGLRVWHRWRQALGQMQVPEEGVISGLVVLIGGVLLVAPGVLTDAVGFLLLIPVTRRALAEVIRQRVDKRFGAGTAAFTPFNGMPPSARSPRDAIDTSGTSLDPPRH